MNGLEQLVLRIWGEKVGSGRYSPVQSSSEIEIDSGSEWVVGTKAIYPAITDWQLVLSSQADAESHTAHTGVGRRHDVWLIILFDGQQFLGSGVLGAGAGAGAGVGSLGPATDWLIDWLIDWLTNWLTSHAIRSSQDRIALPVLIVLAVLL